MRLSREAVLKTFKRDNYTCQNCGVLGDDSILQVSHKITTSLGGSSSEDNLTTLCASCNKMKSQEKLEMKEKNVDSERLNKWVGKYFSDSVPESLYHYTSLNAAKGILDTREMWLSNVRTMNDPDELSYGYRIITKALEELENRHLFNHHKKTLVNLKEVMKHLAEQKVIVGNAEIYLTCFSAAKNKIRQWVTYGDAASGVSLMFANTINKKKENIERLLKARVFETDENKMDRNLNRDIFLDKILPPDVQETVDLYKENYYGFKEVIYVEEKEIAKTSFFKDLVLELAEALNELFSDKANSTVLNMKGPAGYVDLIREGDEISSIATDFFIKMALWALSVKHHHWEDEKEWRLILLLHSSKVNNFNTHFLIKPGMIVPFIKYFIAPRDILEICLGPKTDKVMSHLALDYYIRANPLYSELSIEESDIKMA
ncbi:hypothetical protein C1N73_32590 (plasmid) [Priestia aryabhattai]